MRMPARGRSRIPAAQTTPAPRTRTGVLADHEGAAGAGAVAGMDPIRISRDLLAKTRVMETRW